MTKSARIAVVYYSTFGGIRNLALSEVRGIEKAGYKADLYQITETLPQEVLDKMNAAPKSDDPIATPETLANYDGILFGIPTRYGNQPAQWRAFWDASGALWAKGELVGKYAGVFFSSGAPNSGGEATAMNSMSTFVHHGINFVPLGYSRTFAQVTNLEEIHGGSPWGASTFGGHQGSRKPTKLESEIAEIQGEAFAETVGKAYDE